MVEEDRPDVVKVTIKREKTSSGLVRPHLDLIVVSSRNKKWLCLVEINTSHRTVMFFEAIYESAHTIVPELDRRRV